MSYILDALKKSDEQRQALTLTQDASKPVQQSSSNVKPLLILTLVVVMAAVAGWLLAKSENPESSLADAPSIVLILRSVAEKMRHDRMLTALTPVLARTCETLHKTVAPIARRVAAERAHEPETLTPGSRRRCGSYGCRAARIAPARC